MDAHAARALYDALTARRNGVRAPIELAESNLAGFTVVGGDFVQARLHGVCFAYATLPASRFGKAELEDASFTGSDLAGSDFTSALLRGADLEDAKVDGCVFAGADLRGARLTNWLGTPLSLAGARLDQATIERSELTDEGLRLLVELGARIETRGGRIPSVRSLPLLSIPPHVEILSASEASTRESWIARDIAAPPVSLRSYLQIGELLAKGRADDILPPSSRGRLSTFDAKKLGGYQPPKVGEEFLGVRLRAEVGLGSIARSFRGVDGAGVEVVVRVFDPTKYGASLQFPAFRRGLKCLSDLQGKGIAELRAVAVDKTAYVVRHYAGGNLHDVAMTKLSLDVGLGLFKELLEAVLRIHGEGRLLRSIKPSNVVLDGLAPIITEVDAVDLPTLAQSSGSVGGYGAYAAPEEAAAKGTHSPTADVFALGKLLEFILTGTEPLEALAGVSQLSLRSDLPMALHDLVSRATRPDPVDRYQFIDDVLADLEKVVTEEGVTLSSAQSVRPAVPSRLEPKPLGLGAPRAEKNRAPRRTSARGAGRERAGEARAYWLPRRIEVAVAVLGVLVSAGMLTAHVLRPAAYDALSSAVFYAAMPLGFSAWLLPRPERRLALYRVTMCVALGWLFAAYAPGLVARVAYQRALASVSASGREFAVVQLARIGVRSFAGADLRGTRYFKEDLVTVDFQRANLSEADFTGSVLLEANFSDANLTAAVFNGADLREALLDGAKALETSSCDRATQLSRPFLCQGGRITSR